jgi:hypothetical protein
LYPLEIENKNNDLYKMKSHELAHKLLSMPNMDIELPYDLENRGFIQPFEGYYTGTTGVKGSSDNPFKELLIFKGEKQKKVS